MTSFSECSTSSGFTSLIKSNDPLDLFAQSDCYALGMMMKNPLMPLMHPPFETLPCANACPNPGTLPCGRCKLVSYCSQKCEKIHRPVHKPNCSAPPHGPNDEVDIRPFPSVGDETTTLKTTSGNMPAVDIVNLKNNEQDGTRGFCLAFIASGDLRNVVRTVNALGPEFAGRLHVVLNDRSDTIVSRNIVLLLILGTMSNEAVAADIALHFWYSTFLPEMYCLRILSLLLLVLEGYTDREEPLSVPIGQRAKLTCLVPREITDRLLYTAGPTRLMAQARNAMPARLDARNRALAGFRPLHGVAWTAFWRSGVVLPFSVASDHHTTPNSSLFAPCSGAWLGNHVENPLASWDPNDVMTVGQTYGAQREDIFGCLYFYLSDQLRTFAKRIRELDITFHLFNSTVDSLAQDIVAGRYSQYGLMSNIRFDRIDLGHWEALADSAYDPVCVRSVLTSWTPLLAKRDTAAIISVFADWADSHKEGSVTGAAITVVTPIIEKLVKMGRLSPRLTSENVLDTETTLLDAAYDNSKAFSKFLKVISLNQVARETFLKRRLRHRIVPHARLVPLAATQHIDAFSKQRVRVPIEAKSTDLPHMPDDETWYRYVKLANISFTARYLELARAPA